MRCDWEKDNWDDFLRKTENKDIIIWGAKETAKAIIPILERKRKIIAVVDNDPNKKGVELCGYRIESLDDFSAWEGCAVLICSMYLTNISMQLDSLGVSDYYAGFFMLRRDLENEKMYTLPSDHDLARLNAILYDEESRRVVDGIIEKRRSGNIDYSDLISKPEYLRDDIFSFNNEEIYIDAGAFDGDTVLDFIRKVKDFRKIVAFEANKSNYDRMIIKLGLASSIFGPEILVANHAAVGEKEGIIKISSNGNESASTVLKNGDATSFEKVRCVALDDVMDEATYIKMDIEGCEADAIKGARNLIKKCRPKLAVCVYHRPNDLWELPLMIHSIVPEYKFFIRHHGNIYYDTVLYATM